MSFRRTLFAFCLGFLCAPGLAGAGSSIPEIDSLRAQLRRGEFVNAEGGARAMLSRASAASDSAATLDLLVASLVGQGKARDKEPRQLAVRSVELCKRMKGADDPAVADALCRLGEVLWSKGGYGPPRSALKNFLRFALESVGEVIDSSLYESKLHLETNFTGALPELTDPKDYWRALQVYRRALDIRRRQKHIDEDAIASNLVAIGLLEQDRGEYLQATSTIREALALRQKRGGEGEAECLFHLADLEREWASYEPAYEDCERGLSLLGRSSDSRDPSPLAHGLRVLGDVFDETGQLDDAQATYRRALQLEEAKSGSSVATAQLLLEVARGVDPDSAQALYLRALGILEASLGPYHLDVSTALLRLASAQMQTGDPKQARERCEKALSIRQRALGAHHPDVGRCLVEYGDVVAQEGDVVFADSLYRDALDIYREIFGPDHPRTMFVEQRRAELAPFLRLGGIGFEEAANNVGRLRTFSRFTLRTVPESQAVSIAAYFSRGLDTIMAEGFPARAWDELIRSRGLVLEEMGLRRASLRTDRGAGVDSLWRRFAAARQRLSALLVRGASGDMTYNYAILLQDARQESERAERALAEKSASYRAQKSAEGVGFEDVHAVMHPGDVLVGFCRYTDLEQVGKKPSFWHQFSLATSGLSIDLPSTGRTRWVPHLGAFVLAGKRPQFVPLGRIADVDSLVGAWRREVMRGATTESGAGPGTAAGDALRRAIWDPLQKLLSGASRVFIVPEGSIHLVNFAALPDGHDSYLVESGPLLHTLSTERELVWFQGHRVPTGRGLLAVGGADFDHATESSSDTRSSAEGDPTDAAFGSHAQRGIEGCNSLARTRFAPLWSTATEAEEVGRLWREAYRSPTHDSADSQAVLLLSGTAATELAVKTAAPGRRALHIATHGFFLGQECSSLLDGLRGLGTLLPDEDVTKAVQGVRPSALSGLVLAGANQRGSKSGSAEDGILTAEEIAALDLTSVDWVVLSACETGVGEIRSGEGVFGLRRAFEEAGVRTLVLSLWPVEDASTRAWMEHLYRARLERGLGVSEAMREASIAVLRDRKERGLSTDPFYWGGFVATGDWH